MPTGSACAAYAAAVLLAAHGDELQSTDATQPVPAAIMNVMQKPIYKNASWSMQAVDLASGEVTARAVKPAPE